MSSSFSAEVVTDAAAFTEAASAYLEAHPVLGTVVSSATADWLAPTLPCEPGPWGPWWALVRDADGDVVSVAMRTASFEPHPLYLLPMVDEAARSLAAALHARGDDASAANGAVPACEVLLAELARLREDDTVPEVAVPTRLYELDRLVRPTAPAGAARAADEADLPWLVPLLGRFETEAAAQAGRTHRDAGDHLDEHWVRRRLEADALWVWEVAGTPVCAVGATPPAFGVSRVGPVMTPAEHRGRGYAGALTAHVTALREAQGVRVCLFTDAGNPVSNALYQRLGYRPLADMTEVVLRSGARMG
ncbi:GNAT family N-acetyltransferase [Nocardioides bruguierae]|uniref:GNAT family N-acetyltransferase n=1 Tax=Nocardioides bruguierae TaxID=2945102 RepID=UPI002020D62A|nr:GNAT family N-acetyltransferase [Nocardioides bruguierae]MCL8026477.1 GNAT family N-acetyltransferase [Nocardioides bruguierae]